MFTWCMLGGLIFIFAPQTWTSKFQFAFTRIFSWPLSVSRVVSLSARAQQPPADVVSNSQYNQLQNHLANLTAELNQERQKTRALSGLRDRPALEGAGLVLADVITSSVGGLQNAIIVNRGTNDGLVKGQFVLADNSIVGAISAVSSRTAEIKLITDPTSKIPVTIAELNVSRVMQGAGKYLARILMLSIKHKVRVGDSVYACKKPGFLDTPLIVGKVAKCIRDDENPSVWDITVKPACDIEGLSSVAVLIMNPKNN